MTVVGGSPEVEPDPPNVVRPDLLAYPLPTTTRFLLLVAALLASGLFVGNWFYSEVVDRDWFRVVIACQAQAREQTSGAAGVERLVETSRIARSCSASTEQSRAAFAFGGMASAGLGGVVVLYVAPYVIQRRRRLRPFGPRLEPAAQRFAQLAAEAGLARLPVPVVGPSAQRDAFSYGAPGYYRVALPPAAAVRWRDPMLFDPLVRHELAHVQHRDVALAWLARSIWYVLVPLLTLPVLISAISGDLSLIPDYLWRAVLLALTVVLISAGLLRSREHDADLRAARLSGGPGPVSAVVARAIGLRESSWYRRPLAHHPSPAKRVAVLSQPHCVAHVTFLDGFVAAFLAALTIPLIALPVSILSPGLAELVPVFIAGPLLGGSVGVGLWRASLVTRVTGQRTSVWSTALGVASGLVLGQVMSLGHVIGLSGGLDNPRWLVVPALAGLGGAVIVYSLGEVWADAAPALRRAWTSWVPAVVVTSFVFAVILWMSQALQLTLDASGWSLARQFLFFLPHRWLVITAVAVVVIVVTFALAARRQAALMPQWIIERGTPAPWPSEPAGLRVVLTAALGAGLVGVSTLVGFRLLAGPVASDAQALQRFETYVWLAAAIGAATTLVLGLLLPRRGLGLGALGGPVATLIVMGGFLVLNTAFGGNLNLAFVIEVLRPPVAIGFFLAVAIAPLTLIVRSSQRMPKAWAIAAPTALLVGLGVIAVGNGATSSFHEPLPPQDPIAATVDAVYYTTTVARELVHRHGHIEQAANAIDADTLSDGPTRAGRIRAEIIGPLQVLLIDAESYYPPTTQIGTVHASALTALRSEIESFELFADAYELDDPAQSVEVQAKGIEAQQSWQHWWSGIADLE